MRRQLVKSDVSCVCDCTVFFNGYWVANKQKILLIRDGHRRSRTTPEELSLHFQLRKIRYYVGV